MLSSIPQTTAKVQSNIGILKQTLAQKFTENYQRVANVVEINQVEALRSCL
jgi:hypothetical protein